MDSDTTKTARHTANHRDPGRFVGAGLSLPPSSRPAMCRDDAHNVKMRKRHDGNPRDNDRKESTMPYQADPEEFAPHPTGQHEGIIYKWEDRGIATTPFGKKHRAMIGIESITATMDDDRPFAVAEFLNIAFGENARLRARRTQILGRELLKNEKLMFDPKEILEVRVGYTVQHKARDDGDGVWTNIDALWRLEDQGKGNLQNEVTCIELPEEERKPTGTNDQNGQVPPLDDGGVAALDERRGYGCLLIEKLAGHDLVTKEHAEVGLKKVAQMSSEILETSIDRWEVKLREANIEITQPAGAVTGGWDGGWDGDDDLPF